MIARLESGAVELSDREESEGTPGGRKEVDTDEQTDTSQLGLLRAGSASRPGHGEAFFGQPCASVLAALAGETGAKASLSSPSVARAPEKRARTKLTSRSDSLRR